MPVEDGGRSSAGGSPIATTAAPRWHALRTFDAHRRGGTREDGSSATNRACEKSPWHDGPRCEQLTTRHEYRRALPAYAPMEWVRGSRISSRRTPESHTSEAHAPSNGISPHPWQTTFHGGPLGRLPRQDPTASMAFDERLSWGCNSRPSCSQRSARGTWLATASTGHASGGQVCHSRAAGNSGLAAWHLKAPRAQLEDRTAVPSDQSRARIRWPS